MKISHTRVLVDEGDFTSSEAWEESRNQVTASIKSVNWPPGNDEFVIKPESTGNGVSPITDSFEEILENKNGWSSTGRTHLKTVLHQMGLFDDVIEKLSPYYDDPEDFISSPWFDAVRELNVEGESELSVVEWETGNISSSHRSLNRITLGLVTGIITAGVVILPTREMYQYLTDRVGNYPELEPYFVIWESLSSEVDNGVIEVMAVEHDATSNNVPLTGKLKDGMSDRDVSNVGIDQSDNGQSGLDSY